MVHSQIGRTRIQRVRARSERHFGNRNQVRRSSGPGECYAAADGRKSFSGLNGAACLERPPAALVPCCSGGPVSPPTSACGNVSPGGAGFSPGGNPSVPLSCTCLVVNIMRLNLRRI